MGKTNNAAAFLTTALLGLGASLAFASQEHAGRVAEFQDRIELAYYAGDLPGLEAARDGLLVLDRDARAPRAGYFAAYARFRQGMLAASTDSDAAAAYIDDCLQELKAWVARHPGDAEGRALLGSCYGISTRYNRLGLATRGLEARRHMAAARELAPDNPWVVLQDGLADFSTPRLFGGDRAQAIRKLERATKLFDEAAARGSRIAAWGAAEAWQQLGAMYQAAGREGDAARAAARARELAPAPVAVRIAAL